jgi:hypothetical protein
MVRLAMIALASVLAVGLLYLAADAWLESAGGRQAVERELAARAGMPVRLEGEFHVMLFPAIGVEGTDLVIGGPGAGEAFLHSGEYAVALAARPLLRGELLVRSVRLARGALRLDRVPDTGSATADAAPSLPTIEAFEVSEFSVAVPGGEGGLLEVEEFGVEGFEAGRDARFRVEVKGAGRVTGTFRWNPGGASLSLSATAADLLPGDLGFTGTLDYAASSGTVSIRWPAQSANPDDILTLLGSFSLLDGGARFSGLELAAGGQSVTGEGCLLLDGGTSLQLLLAAEELDLDRLPELPPIGGAPGGDGAAPAGLEVAVRLEAVVVRGADAVARNAVFAVGDDPDCSRLD